MCSKNFIEIKVPHLTKATGACENIATIFRLDYFGRKIYLTQTAQLQLEVLSQYLERVFADIRSFRAEPEIDDRHLTEFSMFEIKHLGNFQKLLKHIEETLWSGIQRF
jgi:aspartyl/asparaginyl-tRNA synthetase